mgnify:CR=1 FL=1
MKISAVKEYEGSLKKLSNLLADSNKKVQGVFYTNTFFSKRYLSRANSVVEDIDLAENFVKLTVATRLEPVGLLEVENTLDMLVEFEAGDIPGFVQAGLLDGSDIEPQPLTPEIVATTKGLYTVDILLNMKEPKVTYQEFKIAGVPFTLLNLHQELDEDFDQTVTLLFGPAEKLYFFSNFYDKELNNRDTKIVLDLIMDENITGKVIKAVKLETDSAHTMLHPYEELISSYMTIDGAYVFGHGSGYVRISREEISKYKMTLEPQGTSGRYMLRLSNGKSVIRLYME